MKNSALSLTQLHQLIDITVSMYNDATENLGKWHQKYLKPADDAELKKAKSMMDFWSEKQLSAGDELESLKSELATRN